MAARQWVIHRTGAAPDISVDEAAAGAAVKKLMFDVGGVMVYHQNGGTFYPYAIITSIDLTYDTSSQPGPPAALPRVPSG